MPKTNHWAVRVFALFGVCVILLGSGIAPIAYNLVQNAGTPLTQRSTLNFAGTGVSCSDGSGKTTCTINGTGVANFSQAFTSQTSVTATHNFGTSAVLTQCFDGSGVLLIPQTITITSVNVVTVAFTTSQSGTCYVNGAAAGTATSAPFSGLTTSTNTTATMTVGTGGSLTSSGSGTINANQVGGSAVSVNTAGVLTVQTTGSGSITLGAIVDGACATGTFTLTGVAAGSVLAPKWPAALNAGLIPAGMVATATNTVTVTVCNLSGSPITAGALTFGAAWLQ
jgi:hypothetical protein